MKEKKVFLKPGKEKAIRNQHHWIFSGAVAKLPDFSDGDFLLVFSSDNQLLGSGYFNRKSSIIGRMVSFDATPPLDAIKRNLDSAIAYRKTLFHTGDTTAYRLVNAEGDNLPGLIIDLYDDVIVVQFGTLGMDKIRHWLVEYLVKKLQPRSIFEKSLLPSRKEEGLALKQELLFGKEIDTVPILENGLQFHVSIADGQKTGFFLDHREMRQWIKSLSLGKRVLNCFSYTGGFTVYALEGGAAVVDSVDLSDKAVESAKINVEINGFANPKHGFFANDVFSFLRDHPLDYDLVILDPPAFAKRQKDVIAACRGYKDINRITIQKMPKNSLLLTSSCSYHVDESLFQKVLFQAACEAKRQVRIIGRHRLAPDHPINICHPENDYLKSFLLYVE